MSDDSIPYQAPEVEDIELDGPICTASMIALSDT